MANANGNNRYFSGTATTQDVSGQLLAQGLQRFGEGLGAAIQGNRKKKEEKQRETTAINFFVAQGMDEEDAKAGVKGVGAENVLQFMNIQQQAAAEAAKQRFDMKQQAFENTNTVAASRRDERDLALKEKMSLAELNQAKTQTEINMLNAKTAAQRQAIAEEQLKIEQELQKLSGTTQTLPGGTEIFHDGNKWERIPNTADLTPVEKAKQLNDVLDPDSPLGTYYARTRNKSGKRAGKLGFGDQDINPAFERTLEALGYESFSDTKKEKTATPATQSEATAIAPEQEELPTITTQEEFDALPPGAKFRNADGTLAQK